MVLRGILVGSGMLVFTGVIKLVEACTGDSQDPYSSGSHVACCDGLQEVLKEWDGDGRDYYKCESSSPTPSPPAPTPWVPTPVPSPPCGATWCDGIDGITVLSPGDSFDWSTFYANMRQAQFSDARHAILLKNGTHDAEIGVGYYTSVMGVGATRHDVVVKSFYSLNLYDGGAEGGACNNFWRSVEGVTATNPSLTWATSQACPIRRSVVQGNLFLSETAPGTDWSSGGFMADTQIQGNLTCGTQQQFFFRNSQFDGDVACSGLSNGAFVGSVGEGDQSSHVSRVDSTPKVAEKPFLVENNGLWHIAVPNAKTASIGINDDLDVTQISMDDVFVAQAKHSAVEINKGIGSKKAVLFTPGIYNLNSSIVISQADFVVLGIGFPTLVSKNGLSAMVVDDTASHARVASIIFEAGSTPSQATAAMLLWKGSHGSGSDIFSRVGAFPGRDCAVTRADVHVQVVGSNTVLDNTWMWHADHDECSADGHSLSDQSYDRHGLQVDGDFVTVYGLKSEHMYDNLVQWNGEDGSVYFYQAELPYHAPDFGTNGLAGYAVSENVTRHHGIALGVYIIYDEMTNVTAFRVPSGLDLENILAWCITGAATQFDNLVCAGSQCFQGSCNDKQCRLESLPGPPSPVPAPTPVPVPAPTPVPSPTPGSWGPCTRGACCNPYASVAQYCPDGEKCQDCGGGEACQCPGGPSPSPPPSWSPCSGGSCCNPHSSVAQYCPSGDKCEECGGGDACQCPAYFAAV